jgi:hypothetical protein
MRMEQINKVLKNEFNLSNSEILIINYLHQNAKKKLTAENICENLGLPKGKIYDILNKLENRDFINVEYKTPKLYFIDSLKKRFEAAFDLKEKEILDVEKKVMSELKPLDTGFIDFKILSDEEEIFLIRQRELLKCKEYRKSSFNPRPFLVEEDIPRGKYKFSILETVVENNIDFKWIISAESVKDFKNPIIAKSVKDIMGYDNIDIKISNIIPSFDICGDTVLIRTTHGARGAFIFIKSRDFAVQSAKVFDDIFSKAIPVSKVLK